MGLPDFIWNFSFSMAPIRSRCSRSKPWANKDCTSARILSSWSSRAFLSSAKLWAMSSPGVTASPPGMLSARKACRLCKLWFVPSESPHMALVWKASLSRFLTTSRKAGPPPSSPPRMSPEAVSPSPPAPKAGHNVLETRGCDGTSRRAASSSSVCLSSASSLRLTSRISSCRSCNCCIRDSRAVVACRSALLRSSASRCSAER
mmetsp:Transcript_51426/g.159503  ORF Transcript_51426/g.159503 Transcript_51426/m.159503 type:complete len:204 (+) Transcript_51426:177-788(+)